ncbi:AraC family transcriptional regulator [Chitinophaga sp. OAE865]|uniref:helix-turn-helix domain-containing protein n=1 Tax=Chitinophaga sp. OAE865 TaxID=2817898 RepID=UPI001AE42304
MPVDILAHLLCHQPSPAVRVLPPSPVLERVVECFCWYTQQHSRKVWAALDGQPALVFLLNRGAVQFTGRNTMNFNNGFFCNGILENTYLEKITAGAQLLVVKFTADGWGWLRPLLPQTGAPLVPLPAAWLALLENVRKVGSRRQQSRLLNEFLEQQVPGNIMGNYLLQTAAMMIKQCSGRTTVAEVCDALHVNYKWLERNFRISTGVTPKHYISNIRFLHAWTDVHNAKQPLTRIALDNGYYDQNHFIKAYKKYTGSVPSAVK